MKLLKEFLGEIMKVLIVMVRGEKETDSGEVEGTEGTPGRALVI